MVNKKILAISSLCALALTLQSFIPKQHHDDDEKPQNLKVLPKNTSGKELHRLMRSYSISLGVRCNFCHVSERVEGQEKPKFDFPSDNKPEKNIARKMILMVDAINNNYIGKITGDDHTLEPITCVTCHMGRTTPIVSVDSLVKK